MYEIAETLRNKSRLCILELCMYEIAATLQDKRCFYIFLYSPVVLSMFPFFKMLYHVMFITLFVSDSFIHNIHVTLSITICRNLNCHRCIKGWAIK